MVIQVLQALRQSLSQGTHDTHVLHLKCFIFEDIKFCSDATPNKCFFIVVARKFFQSKLYFRRY